MADDGNIGDRPPSTDPDSQAANETSTRSIGEVSTKAAGERAERWGRYRLTEMVGAGSFGSVYRAWDAELEREVAIKILHGEVADAQLKGNLLREGRALAKIRHPNVVSVFGLEVQGDRAGLCMEFVRGETLEATLRIHGPLSAREAALVGEDVSRALAAVHRAGFVHRDVKARNVMRERAGRVVLMDFGTGSHLDRVDSGQLDLAGTPGYMAPEVLDGQPASPSSDVYSVGVLLYHLVTSEYPVTGRTFDDVRRAHQRQAKKALSERRPDLPKPFVQVVERALAATPRQRYASATALLEALEAAFGDAPPPVHTRTSVALGSLTAGGGLVAGLIALGFLNSTLFNDMLGRADFADETVWNWFVWGFRSVVAPAFLFLAVLLAIALVVVVRRLALTSPALHRLDAWLRHHAMASVRRLRLDEPTLLSSVILLASASALLGTLWYFSPLVGVILNDNAHLISTAPAQALAILSPRFKDYQQWYQLAISLVAILSVAAWYPVVSLMRHGQAVSKGMMLGGALVVCFAIISHSLPYRLLVHNEFDRARWNNVDCYILGERNGDALVFCPSLPPPRSRILPGGKKDLERVGVQENIFTRFSEQGNQQP